MTALESLYSGALGQQSGQKEGAGDLLESRIYHSKPTVFTDIGWDRATETWFSPLHKIGGKFPLPMSQKHLNVKVVLPANGHYGMELKPSPKRVHILEPPSLRAFEEAGPEGRMRPRTGVPGQTRQPGASGSPLQPVSHSGSC